MTELKWFGHAAHFICGRWCRFHLATQVGDYLVSTVGEYWPEHDVREIHAQHFDGEWWRKNRHLKGDRHDAARAGTRLPCRREGPAAAHPRRAERGNRQRVLGRESQPHAPSADHPVRLGHRGGPGPPFVRARRAAVPLSRVLPGAGGRATRLLA